MLYISWYCVTQHIWNITNTCMTILYTYLWDLLSSNNIIIIYKSICVQNWLIKTNLVGGIYNHQWYYTHCGYMRICMYYHHRVIHFTDAISSLYTTQNVPKSGSLFTASTRIEEITHGLGCTQHILNTCVLLPHWLTHQSGIPCWPCFLTNWQWGSVWTVVCTGECDCEYRYTPHTYQWCTYIISMCSVDGDSHRHVTSTPMLYTLVQQETHDLWLHVYPYTADMSV